MIHMNRVPHLRSSRWLPGLRQVLFHVNDSFYCPGYKLVEDRRIHCANRRGHGAQNFVQGAENSCNPVFIEVGLRLGADKILSVFPTVWTFEENRH